MLAVAPLASQAPVWRSSPQLTDLVCAAHDPVHDHVLAVGLYETSFGPFRTWESIDGRWYLRDESTLNGAFQFSMVWHGGRQRFLLFALTLQGTLWFEWDRGWQPLGSAPIHGPHCAAYDAARDRLVVLHSIGAANPATAEWDGARWTAGPGMAGAHYATIAYDPTLPGVVAFTTPFSGTQVGTWHWHGQQWLSVPVSLGPLLLTRTPTLGFDPLRQTMLLATWGSGQTKDLWRWSNGNWVPDGSAPFGGDALCTFVDRSSGELRILASSSSWPGACDLVARRNGSWVQIAVSEEPGVRTWAAMATDANGDALLFGGMAAAGIFDDTWRWRGSWQRLPTATTPSARFAAQLAFVPALGRVCLFSGTGRTGLAGYDVYEWTGSDWTLSAASPAPVRSGLLAGDPATGEAAIVTPATTWRWRNGSWQGTATNGPPWFPGMNSNLVADAANRRALMYDGASGEVWQWTGSLWSLLPASNAPPSNRRAFGIGWHDGLGALVVNGGQDLHGGPQPYDSWLFDGSRWSQVAPPRQTSDAPALAWSAALQCTVAFGARGIAYGSLYYLVVPGGGAATPLGSGCFGSLALQAPLPPSIGSTAFGLLAQNAGSGMPVVLLLSTPLPSPLPLGHGCLLQTALPAVPALTLADAGGTAAFACPIVHAPQLRGLDFAAQCLALAPASPLGFGTSNGLLLHVGD